MAKVKAKKAAPKKAPAAKTVVASAKAMALYQRRHHRRVTYNDGMLMLRYHTAIFCN